jgi:membrane protein implicated in regulation of membrane protease activity
MEPSTLWWIAAGALLAAELITGTFYLLMISTGFAAGGLAAVFGASPVAQLLVGAVISIAATGYWHLRRARQPARAESQSNRDVHLDLGETLHVDHWAEDGTASARYRGALWQVQLAPHQPAAPGAHHIVAMDGNRLVVKPV